MKLYGVTIQMINETYLAKPSSGTISRGSILEVVSFVPDQFDVPRVETIFEFSWFL